MINSSRPRHRGQGLVEYALILPLFLLIVMVIIDMGRATYYYSAVHNAAREGARYAVINPDDFDGIVDRVEYITVGLNPADITVATAYLDDDTIQVTVTYEFTAATPIVANFLGSDSVTLGSRASMRLEQ